MARPHMMGDIFHISHKAIEPMRKDPIEITEKVDGSYISWWLNPETDELEIRSKGQQLYEDAPSSKMFKAAIESIRDRYDLLVPGQIWRGEYLMKPKHNTIAYDRNPKGHIAIFDIELSMGEYATPSQRQEMAEFIGYETVPSLWAGTWTRGLSDLKDFLELDSFLGGSKIEGVVAKCYTKFYGGKPMMGKLVSDAFKEVHNKEWKKGNPSKRDIVETLIESYATEARWRKSIQHLRDEGELTNSPKDIGPLLKAVAEDIKKEEEDAIKEALWKWAWPTIARGTSRGFPDYYKNYLLEEDR